MRGLAIWYNMVKYSIQSFCLIPSTPTMMNNEREEEWIEKWEEEWIENWSSKHFIGTPFA